MGKQLLGDDGQPILLKEKLCSHGVACDDRGNNACEGCSENSRTGGFLLGICSGWDQVAELAKKRSGAAYADGKDDEARFWRNLAKEAKETEAKRRDDYDRHEKTYPHGPVEKAS